MVTDFTLVQNPQNGENLIFTDTSTGINFSDVKIVRFYFGSFLNDLAENQSQLVTGEILKIWTEYIKLTLPASTYDLKILVAAQVFIPFISGLTVLAGDKFTQTGRTSKYVSPATYLPTANYTPYILTPQDLLFPSNVTVIPAGIYYLQYEQYGDSVPNPLVNMVAGRTYLVEGAGTCVYNSSVYRTGEQITGADTNAVSFTGSATLKQWFGVKFQYFVCTFTIRRDLDELEYRVICGCGCDDDARELVNLNVMLDWVISATITDHTSATLCNTTLNRIQSAIARLKNCIPLP